MILLVNFRYKDTISFPAADSLSESEVAIKYDEVFQEVRTRYLNSLLPEKHLTFVDVRLIENKGENQLQITSAVKGNTGITNLTEKGWKWGLDAGSCDETIGEGDAGQVLEQYINDELQFNDPPPQEHCRWVFDVFSQIYILKGDIELTADNIQDTIIDNHLDYRVYYANQLSIGYWDEDAKCVSHDVELPFYKQKYSDTVEYFLTGNNKLKEFFITDGEYGSENVGNKIICHELEFFFGVPILDCTFNNPIDIH